MAANDQSCLKPKPESVAKDLVSATSIELENPKSCESQWLPEDDGAWKRSGSVMVSVTDLSARTPTVTKLPTSAANSRFQRCLCRLLRSGRYEDHDYELATSQEPAKQIAFKGWRRGCLTAAIVASIILLVNLIFVIWAAATSKSGIHIGILHTGGCSSVRRADTWLHIAINIMGTLLLGGSNYTMQCITAPTREAIDEAHAKGKYLDIGIPSLRNLKGRRRISLFLLLTCSSLPLHFLWNSAVFTLTEQLDYSVNIVTPDFFQSATVDCSQNASVIFEGGHFGITDPSLRRYLTTPLYWSDDMNGTLPERSDDFWYQKDACNITRSMLTKEAQGTLQRMDNQECIETFGAARNSHGLQGDVLVVTKDQPSGSNATILLNFRVQMFETNFTGNNWVCDPASLVANNYKCNVDDVAKNADNWTLGSIQADDQNPYVFKVADQWQIDYCLTDTSDLGKGCQLQYSPIVMIVVLLANAIKLLCIIIFLLSTKRPILATTGDSIASFLDRPDPYTENRPLLERSGAVKFTRLERNKSVVHHKRKSPLRWFHAPSRMRWTVTIVFCTIAIVAVIRLLLVGNSTVIDKGFAPYSLGFGAYNLEAVLDIFSFDLDDPTDSSFSSSRDLLSMVAVANCPQVIASCLYFVYNSIYTSMLSADEISHFAISRKALRTTNPTGLQRSTYWLSLPWKYALPMAGASAFLHWLISQSLFVARTAVVDAWRGTIIPDISYMVVCYSPLAILVALLFGVLMLLVMLANGFRKFKGEGIPLVGSNSLAIAAACQRPKGEEDAARKRVMWGVIPMDDDGYGDGELKSDEEGKGTWERDRSRHCSFTGGEVEALMEGQRYV